MLYKEILNQIQQMTKLVENFNKLTIKSIVFLLWKHDFRDSERNKVLNC